MHKCRLCLTIHPCRCSRERRGNYLLRRRAASALPTPSSPFATHTHFSGEISQPENSTLKPSYPIHTLMYPSPRPPLPQPHRVCEKPRRRIQPAAEARRHARTALHSSEIRSGFLCRSCSSCSCPRPRPRSSCCCSHAISQSCHSSRLSTANANRREHRFQILRRCRPIQCSPRIKQKARPHPPSPFSSCARGWLSCPACCSRSRHR